MKTDHARRSAFPSETYRFAPLILARTMVQYSPGSSTIELPSVLAESGAMSPNRACHGPLVVRAASPYQAFHDCTPCLSRATTSRRAPNWSSNEAHLVNTILSPSNRRRVSIDRLNREDRQLVVSLLEGGSGPKPAGKALPHYLHPKTKIRKESARDVQIVGSSARIFLSIRS